MADEQIDLEITDNQQVDSPSDEDVQSILDATDEELEAILNPQAQTAETVNDEEQTQEGEALEASEDVEESAEPEAQGDDKTQTNLQEASAQEHAKLQARLEQQERFIQQLKSENGELRKEKRERIKQLEAEASELYHEDLGAARKREREAEKIEKELEQLDATEQAQVWRHQQQVIVANSLRPEEIDIPNAAQMLREDGLPPETVAKFEQDPLSVASGGEIVSIMKRNFDRRLLAAVVPRAKELFEENQQLKKQLESNSTNVLSGVQKALKQQPAITSRGGSATSGSKQAPTDFTKMTDSELEAFLSNAT